MKIIANNKLLLKILSALIAVILVFVLVYGFNLHRNTACYNFFRVYINL